MDKPLIKVVMIARPNLYAVPGGDTIQILETANALRKISVHVDVIIDGTVNYSDYSLVHFFNIITPEDILGHILKLKIPYVISPIYVNYREYDKYHRKDIIGLFSKVLSVNAIEYLKTLGKFLLKGEGVSTKLFFIKGYKKSIKHILNNANTLLPNSENEYLRLKTDYNITPNYIVVPNAINTKLFVANKKTERTIILCVARIEGRKNQLNIIRALKNTSYTIVFIGAAAPNQKGYYEQCKKEATPNITFIDFIPQQELLNYYNKAKVHILASWFETTGLSNLEAAVMGCNLVVGNRGDVKDYLGEDAFYCEPNDLNSIKNAVDNAWNSEFKATLKQKIITHYTWEEAALQTYKAYENVLKK